MPTERPVDIYDHMDPAVGPAQRRRHKERLAQLTADGLARRERLAAAKRAKEAEEARRPPR